jgi:molybdopterin synthase catalytic subunit
VTMIHRAGSLGIGEVSVAVAATAPHRAEAFAACRAAIDRIKNTVPIWKKEFHPDGSSAWVDPTRGGRS